MFPTRFICQIDINIVLCSFQIALPSASNSFYLPVTKKTKKHGDRTVAAGTATHVAGILDDGVILNSQEPHAKVRRINEVSDWYQKHGHEVYIRGLDREALAKLAKEGKTLYDLDKEFHDYFVVGA
jgi:murein DD-endopeptidase